MTAKNAFDACEIDGDLKCIQYLKLDGAGTPYAAIYDTSKNGHCNGQRLVALKNLASVFNRIRKQSPYQIGPALRRESGTKN